MAPEPSKTQPAADGDHSSDHSLTDAYHRGDEAIPDGIAFVLIFGDVAHQFHFRRGDPQSEVAERLRAFADHLAGEG